MEVQSREFEEYGRVSFVNGPDLDPARSVIFLGGWNQNPDFMDNALDTLAAEHQIPVIGFSPFDVKLDTKEAKPNPAVVESLGDFSDLPEGNLRRATVLSKAFIGIIPDLFGSVPNIVIGHCGGPNVYLTGLLLERISGNQFLPRSGVLAEPMLAEGMSTKDYRNGMAIHTRATRELHKVAPDDTSMINFRKLLPKSFDPDKSKADALQDIADSRGLSLYVAALGAGAVLPMILGKDDFAAPSDSITTWLEERGQAGPLHHYDEAHVRQGHGYLLSNPSDALKDIVPILASVPILRKG